MDAAVTGAITAVQLDDESLAQQWFELICATYDSIVENDDVEWTTFTDMLLDGSGTAGLGRDIAEQFVAYLQANDSSPLETVGKMREYGNDLPALHRDLTAESTAVAESGGYDNSSWNAFLAENGPRWNGTDDAWAQFAEWFAYQADQQGLAEPADAFIAYAESQGDKAGVFAQYGIQVTAAGANDGADTSNYPALNEGDTGEWVDYLDTMLTSKGF